eukprot:GHVS01091444.1.p2 GENE.GHVS01091444.1~~GHVS01091444.1.p2  ORF type:complete len:237 (-),score=40.95 GHVS01091444.1:325-1035(-)
MYYDAKYDPMEISGGTNISVGGPNNQPTSTLLTDRLGSMEMAYRQASRLGSRLLEEGNKFLTKANLIGEGPKPLRALCFVGGLALAVCSVVYICFIFSILTAPAVYVLHIYEAIFGIVVMVLEAKDMKCLSNFKQFVGEWLKFTTVPGGKGAFYFFIGSLAVSMFNRNLALFVAGVYMCGMGIICGLVHFGLERQLRRTGIRIDDDDDEPTVSQEPPASPVLAPPAAHTRMHLQQP